MAVALLVLVCIILLLVLVALTIGVFTNRRLTTGNALKAGEVVDQIFNELITQIPPEERTPEQIDHVRTMAHNKAKKAIHDRRHRGHDVTDRT